MHPLIAESLSSALRGFALPANQAAALLALLPEHRLDIYATARLAASRGGVKSFACGIINAKSGRCAEDCAFCAQSARHSAQAPVYGLLDAEEILKRAEQLAAQGARYMGIVISGTAPGERDFARLCETARVILARVPISLCASFGILSMEQARQLKEAGYTSYHHNLESSRSWYGRICSTHSYDVRVQTARNAAAAGLRLCSGGIFGLGEGWAERLELSQTLGELQANSIPINFLTPIKGTPLEGRPLLHPEEALDIIAILRLMHPEKDLVICGGRSRTLGKWENGLFFAGANGLMVGDYLTTRGSALDSDSEMLQRLGVALSCMEKRYPRG